MYIYIFYFHSYIFWWKIYNRQRKDILHSIVSCISIWTSLLFRYKPEHNKVLSSQNELDKYSLGDKSCFLSWFTKTCDKFLENKTKTKNKTKNKSKTLISVKAISIFFHWNRNSCSQTELYTCLLWQRRGKERCQFAKVWLSEYVCASDLCYFSYQPNYIYLQKQW